MFKKITWNYFHAPPLPGSNSKFKKQKSRNLRKKSETNFFEIFSLRNHLEFFLTPRAPYFTVEKLLFENSKLSQEIRCRF